MAIVLAILFAASVFARPARTAAIPGMIAGVSVSCCTGSGTTYTIQWMNGVAFPSSTTLVEWGYYLECGDWDVTSNSSAFWHHPTPQECSTSSHYGTVIVYAWDILTHAGESCSIYGGSDAPSITSSSCATYVSADPPSPSEETIVYNNNACAGIFPPASCSMYAIFSTTVGTQCGPSGSPPLITCWGLPVFVQTTPVPQTSSVTGEAYDSTYISSASWNWAAEQMGFNLNAVNGGYFSAAIPNTLLNGPFTVALNGSPTPFSTAVSGSNTLLTLTNPLTASSSSTLTVTGGSSSVGTTAPPYQTTQTMTANGKPTTTTIGSNQAVQTSFTNNSPTPVTAVVYAVVHNSDGQTVSYSTATLTNVPSGGSATATNVLAGLPSGTYSVTIFATSASGTAISGTSTITVTK